MVSGCTWGASMNDQRTTDLSSAVPSAAPGNSGDNAATGAPQQPVSLVPHGLVQVRSAFWIEYPDPNTGRRTLEFTDLEAYHASRMWDTHGMNNSPSKDMLRLEQELAQAAKRGAKALGLGPGARRRTLLSPRASLGRMSPLGQGSRRSARPHRTQRGRRSRTTTSPANTSRRMLSGAMTWRCRSTILCGGPFRAGHHGDGFQATQERYSWD